MAAGGSWAQVAVAEPPKQHASHQAPTVSEQPTAVVDANAIMGNFPLQNLAERLVTIPEVLEEVRDARSRERLAALAVPLHTLQPSEEAIAAVMRFARATGDLHSLSAVDLRLVALAYTLEAAAHGTSHLRELPAPPRAKGRRRGADAKQLLGWGQAGGKWADLDRLDEEAEAAAAAVSGMGGNAAEDGVTAEGGAEALDAAAAAGQDSRCAGELVTAEHDMSRISAGVQAIDLSREQGLASDSGSDGGESAADDDLPDADDAAGAAEQQGGEEDEGQWETAASSKNAARRKKKKHLRYQQRQAARAAQDSAQTSTMGNEVLEYCTDAASEWMSDDGGDGSGSDAEEQQRSGSEDGSEAALESSSSVVSVTADFSMQNVILQMGLRLSTPDGRRITHVSRFVLRCSACFFVTKEAGRLFCPQCGNATMEKVEVTVNAEGQEQYGVRKKHNLRGTRFSLPKPKGGRQTGVPVLREDVMLQRMPHMRASKQPDVDPFTPELHGPDYWFQQGGSRDGAAQHAKGAAAILASWKNNPNERKHVRTNRRRK